ncbi:hypothetical protein ACQSDF_18090, partial [Salmonella enterica]
SLVHLCCSEVSISPLFRWPNSVNHYNHYKQITVADKTNMKDGASTSTVLNTGNKTTKPPNTSLLKSITGNAASLLGLG